MVRRNSKKKKKMMRFQMVFIRVVYANSFTCGMDRYVAIRICPYKDHSLSHLDKALRVVLRSNMQYTCCNYMGERCFCRLVHGTNVELKRKEKLIEIRFHKYYFLDFILHTVGWFVHFG